MTASQRSQRPGVGDVAGLDRPFNPARNRRSADRIGRRQPRHQAIERGRLVERVSCRSCDDGRVAVVHGRVHRRPSGSNGASTGVESRAEPAQHVLEHMVAADAQPVADDCTSAWRLPRCQASRARSCERRRGDLDQRLGLAGHPHDRAVLEHEPVAVAQRIACGRSSRNRCRLARSAQCAGDAARRRRARRGRSPARR